MSQITIRVTDEQASVLSLALTTYINENAEDDTEAGERRVIMASVMRNDVGIARDRAKRIREARKLAR